MNSSRSRARAGFALAAVLLAGCGGGGTPVTLGNGAPVAEPSATAVPSGSATATPGSTATPAGGATGTPGSKPTPTPAPTATPGSGVLAVSPPTLAFDSDASNATQTVTIVESGYTGAFSAATTDCANVVTISQPAAKNTFTVTPLAQGTCTYEISDTKHQSVNLAISVTLTSATAKIRRPGANR